MENNNNNQKLNLGNNNQGPNMNNSGQKMNTESNKPITEAPKVAVNENKTNINNTPKTMPENNKIVSGKSDDKSSSRIWMGVIVIVLVIAIAWVIFGNKKANAPTDQSEEQTQNQQTNGTIQGNKDDLVSFSTLPNTEVEGVISYLGVVKGGYFFEGNILVNILDANKKVLVKNSGTAKDDWMTTGPVKFEGYLDFSGLPKGPAFIEIHNDNPSGLAANDKSILIPVIIN
jgi:hypothetical protein